MLSYAEAQNQVRRASPGDGRHAKDNFRQRNSNDTNAPGRDAIDRPGILECAA
jgi:hypothetical protein